MPDLAATIAECLSLHAEAMAKLGTDRPELDDRIDLELRAKVERQRARVSASLEGGDPEHHRQHVESLNRGLRLVLRRLVPQPASPPPPMPVWNDQLKRWDVPTGQARIDQLAAQFDHRGPDTVDDL